MSYVKFTPVVSLLLLMATQVVAVNIEEPLPDQNQNIIVEDVDVLALNSEIKTLLDEKIKVLPSKRQRLLALHTLLYDPAQYNIRYNAYFTASAIETFYNGSGNCISLANLFIATARYVGIRARYQTVNLERQWRRRDGFYEVPGHVNVVVSLPRAKVLVEFNQAYFDQIGDSKVVSKMITDAQAKAEYYNNLGVAYLNQKKYSMAVAYFKKSIKTHKKLDFVWSNLGVAYKRLGDFKAAEEAYLAALKYNSKNRSAIGNIYILYSELGDETKSQAYAKRAEKYARKNPYYLEKLANTELEAKRYDKAVALFKAAIKIHKLEPDFYHGLAVAYYYENDIENSKKALRKSMELAESEEYKLRYQRKLNALAGAH
ncbi:transglutaminase-like domain-containing protein [Agarilytica rhodophyticola]|uniref:transglutaminase-like domain-containing protein n=1 Tax=Agarilytica rhodophyticola TaxID=1737490 RepID=UPI000B348D29|nr:transglutaminase-like domain-containing protein [Agarilytica rhodophyticola]